MNDDPVETRHPYAPEKQANNNSNQKPNTVSYRTKKNNHRSNSRITVFWKQSTDIINLLTYRMWRMRVVKTSSKRYPFLCVFKLGQVLKFWSKIDFWFWSKIKILVKNRNLGQKSKFSSKIEILSDTSHSYFWPVLITLYLYFGDDFCW